MIPMKKYTQYASYLFLFIVIAFTTGMAVKRYWPSSKPGTQLDTLAESRYVCPMHPEIVKKEAGYCPICGMALVSVSQSGHDHEHEPEHEATQDGLPAVTISPAVINNIGVHTLPVKRQTLWRQAKMSGYVQGYTPGGKRALRVPVAGKIIAVHAKPGQWVQQGDLLLELDVPERAEAQAEHLNLLTAGEAPKLEASRQHLRELGFMGSDIEQLEKSRTVVRFLEIHAPQDGEIAEVNAHEGEDITPASMVLMMHSMGEAMVDVDIIQSQLLWMKSGDRTELRMHHLPGHVWKGTVAVDGVRQNAEHHTYGARLNFAMPEGSVRGDMYGEVRIFGAAKANVLAVPREALIRSEQGDRVVVALGDGRFQPVKVRAGLESDGRVEIVSGLKEGQNVVVSAQFLLDSESSMRAEFMRMGMEADAVPTKKDSVPSREKAQKARKLAVEKMPEMGMSGHKHN